MSGIIAMHECPTLVTNNQHLLPFFVVVVSKIKDGGGGCWLVQ